MNIILALFTAAFYGAYNVLIKMSSGHINQVVGAVVLQITATVVGCCVLYCMHVGGTAH